ncbi:unnamed protein product, partial [Vitis vinifera]
MPSIVALRATTLTKFARSVPENPGVPLAIIIRSTSSSFKTFDILDSIICLRPSTSGLETTNVMIKPTKSHQCLVHLTSLSMDGRC